MSNGKEETEFPWQMEEFCQKKKINIIVVLLHRVLQESHGTVKAEYLEKIESICGHAAFTR